MSQYTTEQLMERYAGLMLEAARYRGDDGKRGMIDATAAKIIKELWERNGGWNG